VDRDGAQLAVDATLLTLAERVGRAAAAELAGGLPGELEAALTAGPDAGEPFDAEEFARRTAVRARVDPGRGREYATAVLATLREDVAGIQELRDRLPDDTGRCSARRWRGVGIRWPGRAAADVLFGCRWPARGRGAGWRSSWPPTGPPMIGSAKRQAFRPCWSARRCCYCSRGSSPRAERTSSSCGETMTAARVAPRPRRRMATPFGPRGGAADPTQQDGTPEIAQSDGRRVLLAPIPGAAPAAAGSPVS
jgi:uncharacterized protein (DUF2267 family)